MNERRKTSNLISFAARHHTALQIVGWLLWIAPFFFILKKVDPESVPLALIVLILAAGLCLKTLGDMGELSNYNRRIRPVEYMQKFLPLPCILICVLLLIGLFYGHILIRFFIVLFVFFACLPVSIKPLHDLISKNREVVTCAQMKELEQKADEAGLSYYEMMENAGDEAFGYICEQELDMLEDILIFCGSGNNGGDGFVVARKAHEYGCEVTVVLACGMPKTPDAITNFELIKDKVRILMPEDDEELAEMLEACSHINSSEGLSILDKLRRKLHNLDKVKINDEDYVIVDAIFGTGFHGSPEGIPKRSIAYMNNFRGVNSIYALDVPSGLPGDYSDEEGQERFYDAVYADCVITFHARKPIHMNRNVYVADHMKKTIVADIGITRALDVSLSG